MTTTNQRRFATAVLTAMLMVSTAPVLAYPTESATKVTIAARDIDLSTAAGAEMLQRRINATIRTACAPVEFGGSASYGAHEQAKAVDACVAGAHAAAAPQFRKLIALGNPRMASN